jgi:hypothetical protein
MIGAVVAIAILAAMIFSTWLVGRPGRLISVRTTLPATQFPERADVYVCDKCGREVTKHFRPGQSHSWKPMGPTRFICRCGQRYPTGAIEWDHLGPWERHRRIRDTFALGALLSAMFSVLGLLAYLVLRFLFGSREAGLIVGLFVTALPFVGLQLTFWPGVLASIWRTRVGSSVEHA